MKLKLSIKYSVAFLALLFVMHELHEIVHTAIGRLICGCWGKRDFNVWKLCTGCSEEHPVSILATIAGPTFTFVMIWLGLRLLTRESIKLKSLGFSLLFANMPFGRLLSAILNSGDEIYILRHFGLNDSVAHIIGLLLILLLVTYPLVIAFKTISNKRKVFWFIGFFILPTVIDVLLILFGLNTILERGFLNEYWILGSPILVSLWTFLVLIILIFSYKNLNDLLRK